LGIKSFVVLDPRKMENLKEAYRKKDPAVMPGTVGINSMRECIWPPWEWRRPEP